jgi:hypothetical protein
VTHSKTGIHPPALDGEGEGLAPGRYLLLELVDARDLAAGHLSLEVLELVGLLGKRSLDLLADLDALVDVLGNLLEVSLAEATAGHGRSADTETTRGQGALVARHTVLVASDVDLLKDGLNTSTVEAEWPQVDKDHVRVSAIGHELEVQLLELVLERLGVGDHLLLVLPELGRGSLLEGNGKCGDGVVVGATLVTREDGEVDLVLKIVKSLLSGLGVGGAHATAEEDHGATGATEGLVGGGGDDVGIFEWRGNDTRGYKAGDVGNVHNQVRANRVGNLAHAGIVDQSAVGRGAGDEDLGAEEHGVLLELVIVDDASLEVDAVRHGLKVGRDSGNPSVGVNKCGSGGGGGYILTSAGGSGNRG